MSVRKKRRTSGPSGQFDLVVVGCGGGHDETNLSGYLCKTRDQPWDAGILGLEAGSGYGALKRLLGTTHPHLFSTLFSKSKSKFKSGLSATDRAYTIYTHLRAFLLTHAHLDHAASLVISAGSLPGPTKYILGAQGVLDDLNRCIFTPGRCWPDIVGWDGNTSGGKLKALPVAPGNDGETADRDEEYVDLGIGMDSIRVRVVPVAHGGSCAGQPQSQPQHINGQHNDHDDAGIYRSSAFFVRHAPTRHEFLFFGDVEADPDPAPPLTPTLSSHHSPTPALTPASTLDTLPASTADNLPASTADGLPACNRPLLRPIWEHAAHLFTSSRLHTLLLECSWPAGRPVAQLFGHLGVEQVRKEMRALAAEVVKARRAADTRQTAETNRKQELIEASPIPVVKPVSTRSQTRTRRAHTESPPPVTRNLKRKATHPVPIHSTATFPSPLIVTDPLAGTLTGLRVIIIHCKEPAPGFNLAGAASIADYIVRQLKNGVPEAGLRPNELGVEYIAAHQGDEFGQSVVPGTIPIGTTVYHGRPDTTVPSGAEWLAFDPEMSVLFLGGTPTSRVMTFTTIRTLRVLYFDGASAAKLTTGSLDTQELLVDFGGQSGNRTLDDRRRLAKLCEWGKDKDIDGYAGAWHGRAPGEVRVKLDAARLVSIYDPALHSGTVARRGLEKILHRGQGLGAADIQTWQSWITRAASPDAPKASGVDWQALSTVIMDRYGARLEYLRFLLDPNRVFRNTTAVEAVRAQLMLMLLTDLTAETIPDDRCNSHEWARPIATHCSSFLLSRLPLSEFTREERTLFSAISGTQAEICRVLTLIWSEAYDVPLSTDKTALLKEWRERVDTLMKWLDWSLWNRCIPECDLEHMCWIPTWPMGIGKGPIPGSSGEEDPTKVDWTPRCIPRGKREGFIDRKKPN
ncbi:hypothetical protein FRC06_009275 [Ceratobasidium sp. 370]|nr:hypothetical protein FRC06_009275 [Ceratobasidium sp. 370]